MDRHSRTNLALISFLFAAFFATQIHIATDLDCIQNVHCAVCQAVSHVPVEIGNLFLTIVSANFGSSWIPQFEVFLAPPVHSRKLSIRGPPTA